jgi:hypothetical protein
MRRVIWRETSEEQNHTLLTSERQGGPASSFQALINNNIGMEMLEVTEKFYWIIKLK